jgi:HAD superfamily hydrolase (TIGR01509 family)
LNKARISPASPPDAVIFDMDGVLIDSNPFHLQNWREFLIRKGVSFDPEKLPAQIFGERDDKALRMFLGEDLSEAQVQQWSEELEANFREAFRPHAQALPGAEALIKACYEAGIPMAVASSAMKKNVDFVVDALCLGSFFRCVASGDEVHRPKPDPEIYLLAADRLGAEPSRVLAFEDSPIGIEAVVRAGMKCVAIASTFSVECLRADTQAHAVVQGFGEVNLRRLQELFSVRI